MFRNPITYAPGVVAGAMLGGPAVLSGLGRATTWLGNATGYTGSGLQYLLESPLVHGTSGTSIGSLINYGFGAHHGNKLLTESGPKVSEDPQWNNIKEALWDGAMVLPGLSSARNFGKTTDLLGNIITKPTSAKVLMKEYDAIESKISRLKEQEALYNTNQKKLFQDYKNKIISGEEYNKQIKEIQPWPTFENPIYPLQKQLRELKVKQDIFNTPQKNILKSENQLGKNISDGGTNNKGVFELNDNYVARLSAHGYDDASRLVNYADKLTSPRIMKTHQVKELNGKIYQVQDKATGIPYTKLSEQQLKNLPKSHIDNFYKDIAELEKNGLSIDISGGKSNIFYDLKKGFQFIDLGIGKMPNIDVIKNVVKFKNGGTIGNNGMFNMTNPNIYKSVIGTTLGGGAATQLDFSKPSSGFNNPQAEYQEGGSLAKAQFGKVDLTSQSLYDLKQYYIENGYTSLQADAIVKDYMIKQNNPLQGEVTQNNLNTVRQNAFLNSPNNFSQEQINQYYPQLVNKKQKGGEENKNEEITKEGFDWGGYFSGEQGWVPDYNGVPTRQMFDEQPVKQQVVEKVKEEQSFTITPQLLYKQAFVESNLDPKAKNSKGYKGLGQIGDSLISDYKKANKVDKIDPFDPKQNYAVHSWSMNELYNSSFIDKPGSTNEVKLAKALAAYNWGRGNMLKFLNDKKEKGVDIYKSTDWLSELPKETREYIDMIMYDGSTEGRPKIQENFIKTTTDNLYKPLRTLYGYKQEGGEINELDMYKNYIDGVYNETDQEVDAQKIYDKLNRIHYKDAKSLGMSPANYILTHVMAKA